MLHSSIDELLKYDCWLAADDVRVISTGLGFGAIKGNDIIRALVDSYKRYSYPAGVNTVLDTKVLMEIMPECKKSDRTKIYGNICIIGYKDYGKYARHYYTYTWRDENVQNRAMEFGTGTRKLSKIELMSYKFICAVRNPTTIAFMDRHKGAWYERFWTFCAYDLYDNGIWYFMKRLCKRIIKR